MKKITRQEKVIEIAELVREIEEEYGSVNNCPDEDKRLIQLHKVVDMPTAVGVSSRKLPIAERRGYIARSRELVKLGYTTTEICNIIGLSKSSVKRFIANVPKPPRFNHVVKSTRNVNTYFATLNDLTDWRREKKLSFQDLEDGNHGYEVTHKRPIRWCDVPLGSLYRDKSSMYVKLSEDFRESMKVRN